MRVTVGGTDKERTRTKRFRSGVGALVATVVVAGALVAPAAAGAAVREHADVGHGLAAASIATVRSLPGAGYLVRTTAGSHSPSDVTVNIPGCTYNGWPTGSLVESVTPGTTIAVVCTGWLPNEQVQAVQFSPLGLDPSNTDQVSDYDFADSTVFTTDSAGNLSATFRVPKPFVAPDPSAVCPPTPAQIAAGFLRCGLYLQDGLNLPNPNGVGLAALNYTSPTPTGATAVGMAATADGGGYWLAWSNGSVTTHGDALDYGDVSGLTLSAPIAHIVPTPDGGGFWLVAGDGGTFALGDAGFYGSMGGQHLNEPVVDLAPTPTGKGYWLVASDGGIFAFGDAVFHGSMGNYHLNKPVVGIAADSATGGYWEVASDGGIFAIDAPFYGSTGSLTLNKPINGMTATTDFGGYLFVASDGGVFAFGDAVFYGSAGNLQLNAPIVGMSLDPNTGGYWLVGSDGGIFSYNAPYYGAK
jgi:hypothetical protein